MIRPLWLGTTGRAPGGCHTRTVTGALPPSSQAARNRPRRASRAGRPHDGRGLPCLHRPVPASTLAKGDVWFSTISRPQGRRVCARGDPGHGRQPPTCPHTARPEPTRAAFAKLKALLRTARCAPGGPSDHHRELGRHLQPGECRNYLANSGNAFESELKSSSAFVHAKYLQDLRNKTSLNNPGELISNQKAIDVKLVKANKIR
jgi:hypothetical protein